MTGELLLPFGDTGSGTLPRFEDPKDDNERLLNYQYDWLVNKDQKAWEALWILSRKMARKFVLTFAKKKGLKLDLLTVEDKTDEAVVYILRRYQRGWYVRRAYCTAIKEAVVHALFHRTKARQLEVFMDDETIARLQKEPAEGGAVYIEGMTKEEAVAKIRAEFFPEIAERILEKIPIIGGEGKC